MKLVTMHQFGLLTYWWEDGTRYVPMPGTTADGRAVELWPLPWRWIEVA
jgi:hypothetical protein